MLDSWSASVQTTSEGVRKDPDASTIGSPALSLSTPCRLRENRAAYGLKAPEVGASRRGVWRNTLWSPRHPSLSKGEAVLPGVTNGRSSLCYRVCRNKVVPLLNEHFQLHIILLFCCHALVEGSAWSARIRDIPS